MASGMGRYLGADNDLTNPALFCGLADQWLFNLFEIKNKESM